MPSNIEGPAAYASYLDYLRQTYGHLIHIQPADMEAAKQGQAQHHHFAQHRSRQARLNARIAQMPIPSGVTGKTLYAALDAYADHAQRATQRESGRVEAATARRLKQSISDMDLADFGYSALERMKEYWASRPEAKLRNGKGTGRPISLDTVDGHLSVARRFVRWLDRSDDFPWQLPRHGLDALKVNLRRLATDEEVAKQRHGVSIFTIEQLATIYKHASDFERLLILLGLNAGMAQAEIITTRWDEVEDNPPTIKRIRRKSGVYAEFILWPETIKALAWWQSLRPSRSDFLMVTDTGRLYTRQRITNAWAALQKRITKKTRDTVNWWLPFKHLRKTAAQLVRNVSDGEITGVFLSHGQPVASDDLADVYSNRPFHKVADALKAVRQILNPMFEAAPDAFKYSEIGRGPWKRAGTQPDTKLTDTDG